MLIHDISKAKSIFKFFPFIEILLMNCRSKLKDFNFKCCIQVRSYSSLNVIWGWSYICFGVLGALEKLKEFGSWLPSHRQWYTKSNLKSFSLKFSVKGRLIISKDNVRCMVLTMFIQFWKTGCQCSDIY